MGQGKNDRTRKVLYLTFSRKDEKTGFRKEIKMVVGGAPITEQFDREIVANGYGPDAASAVDVVKSLTTK